MTNTTKFHFSWITNNGEQIHVSRAYDFNDAEFYANVEFVERYYGVRCRIFITEE